MALLVLVSAVVALGAIIAAATLATLRTLELIRRFRVFSAALDETLAPITAASEELSTRADAIGPGGLPPALARLAASRAKLSVLLAAIADVRAGLASLTALRPQK